MLHKLHVPYRPLGLGVLFFVTCLALLAVSTLTPLPSLPAPGTSLEVISSTILELPKSQFDGERALISDSSPARPNSASETGRSVAEYGQLPLSFEVNRGQTNEQVKFLARGQGYGLFLTPTGAILSLNGTSKEQTAQDVRGAADKSNRLGPRGRAVLSLNLQGADPSPEIAGEDMMPGKVNYFIGNDPSKWRSNVPTYSKVRYENVYRGIDLVYYGNQQQLEYDFVVAPKANPRTMRLRIDGAEKIRIDTNGDLVLTTLSGDVIQRKPIAYQEVNGQRNEVAANYRLDGKTITFDLGTYDKTKPLTIDPVLVYSTYLGGGSGDFGLAIAVDAQGNAFLTGNTFSINFPLAAPFQATNQGGLEDAFVTKLTPSGTALVYSTYLGGTFGDSANTIAVDAQGNAYLAGTTTSNDFPTSAGSVQGTKDGVIDAFVTKLNPSGSALVYSTYVGGDNIDQIFGLAVSADGRAYLAGRTDSTRLISTPLQRHGHPVFKSSNGAATWSASDTGLTASNVVVFASSPANSNVIYAGTTNGVFKSIDAGATWSVTGTSNVATAPENTTSIVVDPSDPNVVYVSTLEGGVHKSTDGGGVYVFKNGFPGDTVNTLAIDPLNPATLYAGTIFGMFKTTNGGDTWVEINTGIINVVINEVAIDPANPAIVYAGTRNGMYKTTNGGDLWFPINDGTINGGTQISVVTIDPLNPAILYAAQTFGSAQIFKTTNGGTTWTVLTNGLPLATVGAIAVDPVTSSTLYAGSVGRGIYKSTDSGASWTESNVGLSNMSVSALLIDRNSPAILYAGTLIGFDAFATRLNPTGSTLEQLFSFGGDETDEARGIALDSTGLPYIVGFTNSTNFPLANAFQSTMGGFADAFVAKLNAAGSGFVYSTYLGGNGTDQGRAIAVRGETAYVVGQTSSSNFPTVNAFQPALGQSGSSDAFVTKLNPSGSALDFSSYLGGEFGDQAFSVAVDAEGNSLITGLTSATNFPTVDPTQAVRGGSSDAFVTRVSASGSSMTFSSYLGGSAADQGNGIAIDQNGNAYIIGTTSSNNFPTVNPLQGTGGGSSDVFITKIGSVAAVPPGIKFTATQYSANEGAARVQIDVTRIGIIEAVSAVDYATSDTAGLTNCNVVNGVASSRCDYATTVGRLSFAAGEMTKSISIPIVDDAYAEGDESFTITVSNATGIPLGTPATATVTITDNETSDGPNPIDQTAFFVRQQYVDFLNREPDPPGDAAWQAVINNCPAGDTTCDRIHVSSSFFRSAEFQGRGYFVYRFYPVAFGRKPDYVEFIPDLAKVSGFLSEAELEAAKLTFIAEFMSRQEFVLKFNGLNNTEYVDTLLLTAGITHPARDFWIVALGDGSRTRAQVLREIAESTEVYNKYFNQAFVVMQYFGYLRRDPDELYLNWIAHLDSTGDYRSMINGFMNSLEYRFRFGP